MARPREQRTVFLFSKNIKILIMSIQTLLLYYSKAVYDIILIIVKPIIHLQKFKSRESWENYIWRKLIGEFIKINSGEEINQLLNMLLTAHEKKQLINRVAAISLLRQEKSYREIGEMLWLSSTTISAIRKSLREQKYTSRYMRKKKQEKKPKIFTKEELKQLRFSAWIESFFTLPPPPLPHPRLMRQLGFNRNFPRKKN